MINEHLIKSITIKKSMLYKKHTHKPSQMLTFF
jgi:hypothetical protein